MNENCINKKQIKSITGLKVIAMFMIFWWHSTIPKPNVDLGARACEFLFLSSGFLVCYNHFYDSKQTTIITPFKYIIKKIINFWPLHFIVLFFLVFYSFIKDGFTINKLFLAIVNAFLLQSWSDNSEIYFSYNGPTWFLSSLMFCYFLSPILLYFIKKTKKCWISLIISITMRIFIDIICFSLPTDIIDINVHISPIVRSLEFFVGMSLVPIFFSIKNRRKITNKNDIWSYTFLEFFSAVCSCLIFCLFIDLPRVLYLLLFCIILMVYVNDSGYFSKFLSLKIFALLGLIQFEFFILHQPVIFLFTSVFDKYINLIIINLFSLFVIILLSILYKLYCKERISCFFRNILLNIKNCLFIHID